MTINEAIKILKSKLDGSVDTSWEWTEAVRMAIQALEDKRAYCMMAGRPCFAHGTQIAWCLSCPHISEEDRNLVRKAVEGLKPKTWWIPVIWHEITDEERNREGYPKDWVVYIDCEMPSDEQKILVTTRWGTVEADVCYEDGEFSLDSGYDWIDDIIAWMPRPEPYDCGAKMGGENHE